MKAEHYRNKKRYYKNLVQENTRCIVNSFVAKLRAKLWAKKIDQINNLAVSSSEKKVILVTFGTDRHYYSRHKKFYIVFEIVEKDGFKLDLSVYKNYIFFKILPTLNICEPKDYSYILESVHFEICAVETILNSDFSYFDKMKVIKCISRKHIVYNDLIQEFRSKFYKGVSFILTDCLKHTFEKCAKIYNIDITNVATGYLGKTVSAFYYQNRAQKLYNSGTINDYSDDVEVYDEDDIIITFKSGISYYNNCRQCNSLNEYGFSFHIGFDLKSKMHSIVYNRTHYTIVNIDELFIQLLKDGFIYDKPICQNCCKKNQVDQEVSMVMSKLPGLMYIGEPLYAVKSPLDLNHDRVENEKECITIRLPIESSNSMVYLNKIELIKRIGYEKVEVPIPNTEGMRSYTYTNCYTGLNGSPTHMVAKQITKYTARLPIFRKFILWSPASDVTIAFRNMQIAFVLCQSMMSYRLPDHLYRYIFGFIMIPDMDTNVDRHQDFDLGFLDNSKLIEDFVNKVNFRSSY